MLDLEAGILWASTDSQLHPNGSFVDAEQCRTRGVAFKGGRAGMWLEGKIVPYNQFGYFMQENCPVPQAKLYMQQNEVTVAPVVVTPSEDGYFQLSFIACTAGIWNLTVRINEVDILGSPFSIEITPGHVCAMQSILQERQQHGYVSNYKEFVIYPKDGFGNPINEFVDVNVSCTGGARVVSVTPMIGGGVLVVCYIHEPNQESRLCVQIHGCNVVNSPLLINAPSTDSYTNNLNARASQADVDENDPLIAQLNQLKIKCDRLDDLTVAKAKVISDYTGTQSAALLAYNATRMQLVHTIPASFVIEEPNETLIERRQQFIQRHDKVQQELNRLISQGQQNESIANEISETLVQRYKKAQTILEHAKEALALRRKNIDACMHKMKIPAKPEKAVAANAAFVAKQPHQVKPAERLTSGLSRAPTVALMAPAKVSTTPDRPNTLAFWLLEGRFKPTSSN